MPRIVSLLPSATEILCLIGGRGLLVGRSHECDFPPHAPGHPPLADVPILTASRTHPASGPTSPPTSSPTSSHTSDQTPDPTSTFDPAAVDRAVREQLASGRSLYALDAGLLARLDPDVIITQDLCSVCSIDLASVRRIAAGLPRPASVLSLNPSTIEGVWDDMLAIGRAAGLEREAEAGVVACRERLFAAAEHVNPYDDGPSVAVLDWTDPLFIAGHWTPQLVERAGGRHPLNPTAPRPGVGAAVGPQMAERVAGPSVVISPEALVAARPEHVIIAPCGVGLAEAARLARELARKPWFRELPAARNGRVVVVDGHHMFSRPGPRLVDAFEFLVGLLTGRRDIIPPDFPCTAVL